MRAYWTPCSITCSYERFRRSTREPPSVCETKVAPNGKVAVRGTEVGKTAVAADVYGCLTKSATGGRNFVF